MSKGALLLLAGVVAVLLSWVGITLLRTDPTSAPAAIEKAPIPEAQLPAAVPAPSEVAPVVSAPTSTEAKPVEPEVRPRLDASPSPINQVIPDVARSARDTIRGTIRVSVRVIVDKEGSVLAATADEPGPSRYFERISVEAAKKWTFTPAQREQQRVMLVRFYFKRAGTTARARSP